MSMSDPYSYPASEDDTRADLIDPKLRESGWGIVEGSRIRRNYPITAGRVQSKGRGKPLRADYLLVYRGRPLAVVEAKREGLSVTEGVGQAKDYADKLQIKATYSSNGREIYQILFNTGEEKLIDRFPTPDELWDITYPPPNTWQDKFNAIPFYDVSGTQSPRYYQEIAVNKVLDAIANDRTRILLTLATGTGKTYIACQIVCKLFKARWNLAKTGKTQPKILFLTDRNTLADQAFSEFVSSSVFTDEKALTRIKPEEIRKKGKAIKEGSIFFTIFQTFMTEDNKKENESEKAYRFFDYEPNFFDLIIIDECHRGGASDESSWRGILEYFSPAVQLGLTATPKRKDNIDTYQYFGEPVYIYSLKEGINNGFLTPFKVRQIETSLDEYIYSPDDDVIEGEIDSDKVYTESDFNTNIEIRERELKRVQIFLSEINLNEKTLVFCATQEHAGLIRDLINQEVRPSDPSYCVRVTANDGERGEKDLRTFQDNDKSIPTILTTSRKLSTGVNARNVRNIVLLRPIKDIIEFKQIVGRGTRLFDGKAYFTIYDFVGAYRHFKDKEWDGEPLDKTNAENTKTRKVKESSGSYNIPDLVDNQPKIKIKIRLRDGKEQEIEHSINTLFYADGKPISAQEFLNNLYGSLPNLFKDEAELRQLWSIPTTRKNLLDGLEQAGFDRDSLNQLKELVNAPNSDLFDVLEFISFSNQPLTRQERVNRAEEKIFALLNHQQREFIEFVLSKYIETGDEELNVDKLASLLELKYHSVTDAMGILGDIPTIRNTFIEFQKHLYNQDSA
jgi:type I restriction enzyme, R subunit